MHSGDYFTSKASNGDWIDKPRKPLTGGPDMKRMHLLISKLANVTKQASMELIKIKNRMSQMYFKLCPCLNS